MNVNALWRRRANPVSGLRPAAPLARPLRRRPLLALGATAVAIGLSATPSPAASLYYGAMVDGAAPSTANLAPGGPFDTFEKQAGKKMSLLQWGQPWKMNGSMQAFPTAYMNSVRAHGSIPVLNWCSWELGKGTN
jgi:hypothetical protein